MDAAYTFSKAIEYNDNSDAALDFNWPGAFERNRALTGYDRPHNFQLSGIAELPFGKNHRMAANGWKSRILAGGSSTVFSRPTAARRSR